MTSSTQDTAGEDGFTPGAGSSSDQNVTGEPETGTFTTDEAPTGDTPVHGSSNVGLPDQEPGEGSPGARTTYE
jgi:hypothetical protein